MWELESVYINDGEDEDGLSYWKSDIWDTLQKWAIGKYPMDHGWTDIYPETNESWVWHWRKEAGEDNL